MEFSRQEYWNGLPFPFQPRDRTWLSRFPGRCFNLWATRSPSLTIPQSFPKFMSIVLVMPSSNLILWCPLLLLPSILPSIRVFSNESALCIRWPKYWSFSVSPSNEYSRLISFRIDWFDWYPCSPRDSQESSLAPQFKSINPSVLSLLYCPTLTSAHDHRKNHSFDYFYLSLSLSLCVSISTSTSVWISISPIGSISLENPN